MSMKDVVAEMKAIYAKRGQALPKKWKDKAAAQAPVPYVDYVNGSAEADAQAEMGALNYRFQGAGHAAPTVEHLLSQGTARTKSVATTRLRTIATAPRDPTVFA